MSKQHAPRAKYTVIYGRKYQSQGGEKVHWMHIGNAWEAPGETAGMDVVLHLVPPANDKGEIRFLVRLDDREGYYGPGEPRRGARRGEVSRDEPQRRSPEHRERTFGGAAGQDPEIDPDDIPF